MRGRRLRENEKKKAKKRARRRAILVVAGVLVLLICGELALKISMSGHFYQNTVLNGFDVSGKNADEVTALLKEAYSSLSLCITEDGTPQLEKEFSQIGYTVNEEKLHSDIEALMARQGFGVVIQMLLGSEYGMRVPFTADDAVFQTEVAAEKFASPRVATTNAQLTKNGDEYVIEPEVYGNDLDDAKLQEYVKEEIGKKLMNASVDSVVTVEVPKSFYRTPEITQQNEELVSTRDLYNKYCKAQITYTFGEQTQVLGWDTIQQWITDGGEINEDSIYNYAQNLAADYNTIYVDRVFETTDGRTITLPSNDYGYQVDVDGEFSQLKADIYANAAVQREPIYAIEGFSRNGYDDLNGNYVEVDLTAQHLWFYRDGALVVESGIISGLPKDDRETTQGAFAIPYKQSPANLVGQGGGPGESWDVEVQYWMPFHDGQGLHDASWQSNFGGTTYMTAGSHGCINLPVDVAGQVFYYMEENMPIILYK